MTSVRIVCLACGLSAAFAVAPPAAARAAPARPINLSPPDVSVAMAREAAVRSGSRGRNRHHFANPLAVQLATATPPMVASPSPPLPVLAFRDAGPLHREVQSGYRDFTESVARRVWTEPDGRRVIFDVGGKPGVGVEIPLR